LFVVKHLDSTSLKFAIIEFFGDNILSKKNEERPLNCNGRTGFFQLKACANQATDECTRCHKIFCKDHLAKGVGSVVCKGCISEGIVTQDTEDDRWRHRHDSSTSSSSTAAETYTGGGGTFAGGGASGGWADAGDQSQAAERNATQAENITGTELVQAMTQAASQPVSADFSAADIEAMNQTSQLDKDEGRMAKYES
jgi:hypothetical protein